MGGLDFSSTGFQRDGVSFFFLRKKGWKFEEMERERGDRLLILIGAVFPHAAMMAPRKTGT